MRSISDLFSGDFAALGKEVEAARASARALMGSSAAEYAQALIGRPTIDFAALGNEVEAARASARALMGSSATEYAQALMGRPPSGLTYDLIRLDVVTALRRSSSFVDLAHEAAHLLRGRADVELVISAPIEEAVAQSLPTRNIGTAVPTPLYVWAGSPTATLAVVFTDIIGSAALGVAIGNEAMRRLRKAHFRCGENYAKKFHGRVIKTNGDELMVAFRSALDAFDFVRAIQDDPGDARITLRAAIHVGLVDVEDDDMFGTAVDFTARLLTAAIGAELILSADAKRQIDQERAARHVTVQWTTRSGLRFKGFDGESQTVWICSL
jgi:class 3 adenylate cyclase